MRTNFTNFESIDGILTIDEYKTKPHYMLYVAFVKTKCGKVFEILKTTQGFAEGEGFYISPHEPLNDGNDEVSVNKTQEDVVNYLENEGWLSYQKNKLKK